MLTKSRLALTSIVQLVLVGQAFGSPVYAAGKAPYPMADAVAQTARAVAASMDTVGWCYAGVKKALDKLGVDLYGGAAWQAKDQLLDSRKFHVVSGRDLHRGDILVHGRSSTHPYGHIAVYLGHGEEASDHLQHVVLGGSYGATVVFRPAGSSRISNSIASGQLPSVKPLKTQVKRRAFSANAHAAQTQLASAATSPSVDPKQLAAAANKAKLFAYLYQQGAISRNEAQAKLQQFQSLQTQAHDKSSDVRLADSH